MLINRICILPIFYNCHTKEKLFNQLFGQQINCHCRKTLPIIPTEFLPDFWTIFKKSQGFHWLYFSITRSHSLHNSTLFNLNFTKWLKAFIRVKKLSPRNIKWFNSHTKVPIEHVYIMLTIHWVYNNG